MSGLLLKDLKLMSVQAKAYIFLIVAYAFIGIAIQNVSIFCGIVSMLVPIVIINSIAYDEKAGWERYSLTMPVSRKAIVISKYILSGIIALITMMLNMAVSVVVNGIGLEQMGVPVILLVVSLFCTGGILPIIFKFGTEKSRIVMFVVMFIPAAIIMIFARFAPDITNLPIEIAVIAGLVFILAFLGLSLWLSLKIYQNKEF